MLKHLPIFILALIVLAGSAQAQSKPTDFSKTSWRVVKNDTTATLKWYTNKLKTYNRPLLEIPNVPLGYVPDSLIIIVKRSNMRWINDSTAVIYKKPQPVLHLVSTQFAVDQWGRIWVYYNGGKALIYTKP